MNILYDIMYVVCAVVALSWVCGLVLFCWVFLQYRKAEQAFWKIHHDDILPKQEAFECSRKDRNNA